MNPDEILTEGWVSDPDLFPSEIPDSVKRSRDYYAYRRRYANGREVWEWHKRGSGSDGQDPVVDQQTVVLQKIKDDWDKKVAQSQPTATSQATALRQTENIDGRVKQWNPETQRYDIDLGGAGAPAKPDERKDQQNVERKRNSEAIGIPFDDIERREWEDAKAKEAAAKTVQEKELALRERTALENAAHQKWQQGFQERQLAGTEAERAQNNQIQERQLSIAESKAKRETLKDGTIIEQQADGTWKPITIEGQPQPGQGPSIADLQVRYGTVVEDLQAYAAKLQDALAKGIITQAEHDKRWGEAKAVAQTKVNELNNLVTTQRGLYSDQSANWRQEQATANTRLNASNQNLALGTRLAESLTGASGAGRAGALFGTLMAGKASGEMYGGYASGPPPALPPAAAQLLTMGLDGKITIDPRAMAQQQTGGGATPGGMPAAMGSIDDAVKADISNANPAASGGNVPGGLPRIPGGGFLPPGSSNLSYSGGQVRAPGYNAMPPSAMMQTLPPDLLEEFAGQEDALSTAMAELGMA